MNAHDLIDPTVPPGLPAPFWFVQLFKVLGFTLHMVPMHLWYAGLILAVWMHLRGNDQGKQFGRRLIAQMPIIIAFGVNFGIVPLLFIQLGYYKVFYPATILMAWFWMMVFLLLIPAYYGVYAYAFGLGQEGGEMAFWRRAAGWVAAVLFLWIGFTMANGLSLSTNVAGWPELYMRHSVAGAATGTALNVGDISLWPRWLLMFGLALGTTAAWSLIDAAWFVPRHDEQYKSWATRWAFKLTTASLVLVIGSGAWYAFGTWRPPVTAVMFRIPGVLMFALAVLSPGLVWLLVFRRRHEPISRQAAGSIALAQLGVLVIHAISRQIVQDLELKPFFDVAAQPTAPQWGPMAVFLGTFVLGAAIVVWMLAQVVKART